MSFITKDILGKKTTIFISILDYTSSIIITSTTGTTVDANVKSLCQFVVVVDVVVMVVWLVGVVIFILVFLVIVEAFIVFVLLVGVSLIDSCVITCVPEAGLFLSPRMRLWTIYRWWYSSSCCCFCRLFVGQNFFVGGDVSPRCRSVDG